MGFLSRTKREDPATHMRNSGWLGLSEANPQGGSTYGASNCGLISFDPSHTFKIVKSLAVGLSLLLIFVGAKTVVALNNTQVPSDRKVSVGAPGKIEQLLLPGSELEPKPIVDDRTPIIVRIIASFPHGDSYRYDLSYQGLEPGVYDLAEFLIRKDGTSTENLPPIRVEILSLLPPGQIEPNELETGILPRLGGYRILIIVALTLWLVVLIGLIFYRPRKSSAVVDEVKPLSLAELLQPRLQKASQQQLSQHEFAELERMLIGFWRRRLGLESVTVAEALVKIKADAKAGPLVKQIQLWLHSPHRDQDVDLKELLEPYQHLSSDLLEQQEREAMRR